MRKGQKSLGGRRLLELVFEPVAFFDGAISISELSDSMHATSLNHALKLFKLDAAAAAVCASKSNRCYPVRCSTLKLALEAAHIPDMQGVFQQRECLFLTLYELFGLKLGLEDLREFLLLLAIVGSSTQDIALFVSQQKHA